MTAPRQTLSYLRNLFADRGLEPKAKLGQNFLIDLNLIDLIARSAELDATDIALEVGSGTGSLTAQLAELAGHVVTVEIDPGFQKMVAELLADRANVTLVAADALKNKNEIHPKIFDAIASARAANPSLRRLKLVANLPYVVATPVIGNLLVGEPPPDLLVATVQWEIAERMMATVGSKEYSSLAVLVQSVADVELVRKLAPSVFWPKPKVDSAIVKITPNPQKRARVGDVPRFRTFLRDLYTHRRKNLRGALVGWPNGRRDKAEVDAKLAELGFDGGIRAEALDIDQHLRLCAVFA